MTAHVDSERYPWREEYTLTNRHTGRSVVIGVVHDSDIHAHVERAETDGVDLLALVGERPGLHVEEVRPGTLRLCDLRALPGFPVAWEITIEGNEVALSFKGHALHRVMLR